MSQMKELLKQKLAKDIDKSNRQEIYYALLEIVKEKTASQRKSTEQKRKLYYISAEFLLGKLLCDNLINLGIYDEVDELLKQNGHSLSEVEQCEPEPSLGNGGLGRLAACFLDSIATLGLNAVGIGLNYHFGLFEQRFEKREQKEYKNPWIEDKGWLTKTDFDAVVNFREFNIKANMYDIDVVGYGGGAIKLHLFDAPSVSEKIVKKGINFDKTKVDKNITLFLYPDDSDEAGHKLRIYQQYFMVACGAKLIIEEAKQRGSNLLDLGEYAVIQINDTHPSMIIPELIRLLCDEGVEFNRAADIVAGCCAYTNHTILAEALEKWPLRYFEEVVPALVPIIKRLDEKVKAIFAEENMHIIDSGERVHMAHIDIHFGFSVNGVAALHTEILKNSELSHFARVYPEKFSNKTNGITFRRWLLHCNPRLSSFIEERIGDGFKTDALELKKLMDNVTPETLQALSQIKAANKRDLAEYLLMTQDIKINPDSIYDIQIKRLHEYKRQQMNALYIINKYKEIKSGILPARPITFLFGAKAAPAYEAAKDIIHLILCLARLIDGDKKVSKHLKVVMVENYNVTLAQKLIPACDISEQISLASKEASGTGNMKFMLNGAVTLGTQDGANVEIAELVGEENIYTFGRDSDFVIKLYDSACYGSGKIMEHRPHVRELVEFIRSEELLLIGNKKILNRLYQNIATKDWFMSLLDLEEYIICKDRMLRDYENRDEWSKKALLNIANAGFFSSDRTIKDYNEDIWKL